MAKAQEGVDVKSYPCAPEYLSDLVNKRIDAALNDQLMTAYLVKTANITIRGGAIVGDPKFKGIPFRQGPPKFKAALNQALKGSFNAGEVSILSEKSMEINVTHVLTPS